MNPIHDNYITLWFSSVKSSERFEFAQLNLFSSVCTIVFPKYSSSCEHVWKVTEKGKIASYSPEKWFHQSKELIKCDTDIQILANTALLQL